MKNKDIKFIELKNKGQKSKMIEDLRIDTRKIDESIEENYNNYWKQRENKLAKQLLKDVKNSCIIL